MTIDEQDKGEHLIQEMSFGGEFDYCNGLEKGTILWIKLRIRKM